jgi:hypothetical protein
MRAVTVRNLPPELARIIRRRAIEKRVSINKAVISLLEESIGSGRAKPGSLHHDLDALAGSWTDAEAAAFEGALAGQRGIDRDVDLFEE